MIRLRKKQALRGAAFGSLIAVLILGVGTATATLEPDGSQTDASTTTSPSSALFGEGITPPSGGGGNVNNEVVVNNISDGRFANRSGFGVARVTGDVVENQNAAAATSSCTDCRTVAVAVQVVVVMRTDASVVSPRNLAVALNVECTRCDTFAAAYQYVVTTDGLVRFMSGAEEELTALHDRIRQLAATDGIPFPQLEAQIDAIVEQMWAIVDNELVEVGGSPNGRAFKDTDEASGNEEPTPEPTSSASSSSSPDPEAREEESPDGSTTTPSPQPSESETPEPSPSDS